MAKKKKEGRKWDNEVEFPSYNVLAELHLRSLASGSADGDLVP
jgi:hypothetical protein